MRRSTSFRDQGGIDTTTPPPPPSPPKFADSCRVWAPPPPPKGLIYQAKRHRTHPNIYFALKQRKLQLEKSSFRDKFDPSVVLPADVVQVEIVKVGVYGCPGPGCPTKLAAIFYKGPASPPKYCLRAGCAMAA